MESHLNNCECNMKKRIVSTIATGILGLNVAVAAPQVSDIIDPIFETEQLPNSYYVKEKNQNSMYFANSKIPNLSIEVSFVKNNSRQFYEIVADFMYKLTHKGDNINQCMNDPTYKPFASYQFLCVKNQDSLQYVIFTQFEDDNNQPSDFTRIVSISSKTGDNATVEDLAAMINTANYQLGFFENFNIPQKSVLKYASNVDYSRIDLEGMQNLSLQKENYWAAPQDSSSLVQVTSTDITNQGMKFFLKDGTTNEKYIITYVLTTEKKQKLTENTQKAINSIYHNCKHTVETEGADSARLSTKCDEGAMGILIKDLNLKKYEFDIYEIVTAPEQLLKTLEENKGKFDQIQSYLYKQFFDSEMLNQKDNVFAYIQDIENNLKPEAGIAYPYNSSTAKTIESEKAVQSKNKEKNAPNDNRSQSDKIKEDIENSAMITTHSSSSSLSLSDMLTYGGLASIALALIILFIFRRRIKDKVVPYMQQKAAEKEQFKQTGVVPGDSGGELIAEIEAERIRREKERYKQQKEAEKLAKELEERKKNETEEERAKRKASLDEFMQKSAIPGVVASSGEKEQGDVVTETAQNQTVSETGDTSDNTVTQISESEPDTTPQNTPAPIKSPQQNTVSEPVEESEEEKERRRLKEEKIQREKECQSVKLKGEDLLMKMKMKQKQSSTSSSSETKSEDQSPKEEAPKQEASVRSFKTSIPPLKPLDSQESKPKTIIEETKPDEISATENTIDENYDPSVENTIIPAFSNDDFVTPSESEPVALEESQPATGEHHKAKNPFDALVTKGDPSKYSSFNKVNVGHTEKAKDSDEFEIDLSDENLNGMSEDSLFGSNNDTVQKYNESEEINLDINSNDEDNSFTNLSSQSIFNDDNMVQPTVDTKDDSFEYIQTEDTKSTDGLEAVTVEDDLSNYTGEMEASIQIDDFSGNSDSFANSDSSSTYLNEAVDSNDTSYLNESVSAEESVQIADSNNTVQTEPENKVEDTPQIKEEPTRRKSTKRVRRFNMGSLSISLHDE